MECIIEYGHGCNFKFKKQLRVAEAFRLLESGKLNGYAFINIYYNDKLVYTTQGLAGRCFICEGCPYFK